MITISNTIEQSPLQLCKAWAGTTPAAKILAGLEHEWRERTAEVILKPLLAQAIANSTRICPLVRWKMWWHRCAVPTVAIWQSVIVRLMIG